jgi:hypothetical protein
MPMTPRISHVKKAQFSTGGVEHAFTRILQPFSWLHRAVYKLYIH